MPVTADRHREHVDVRIERLRYAYRSELFQHLVIVRVRANPKPKHPVVVTLADGAIVPCDSYRVDRQRCVDSFEPKAVVCRIGLESAVRELRSPPDRLGHGAKLVAERYRCS